MRVVLVFFVSLIGFSAYFLWKPLGQSKSFGEFTEGARQVVEASLNNLLYQRSVEVSGLQRLSKEDVEKLLPAEKSNLWWKFNSAELVSALNANPLIKGAEVLSCSGQILSYLKCFQINITEKIPRFVAFIGSQAWVVSDEGSLITPLSDDNMQEDSLLRKVKQDLPAAILIKTPLEQNGSPDAYRARLSLFGDVADIIKEEAGLNVETINVANNGELEVSFKSRGYKANFDFTEGDLLRMREEARRLKKMLLELQGSQDNILRVDLAYNRLGVVTMKPDVVEAKSQPVKKLEPTAIKAQPKLTPPKAGKINSKAVGVNSKVLRTKKVN